VEKEQKIMGKKLKTDVAMAVAAVAATAPDQQSAPASADVLRLPAETKYADELAYLREADRSPRPFCWQLSPRMIRTFILGRTAADVAHPVADHDGHAAWSHRPIRGADALHFRRAGCADFHPERKVRGHPRAVGRRRHRVRPARFQHPRHGQQP